MPPAAAKVGCCTLGVGSAAEQTFPSGRVPKNEPCQPRERAIPCLVLGLHRRQARLQSPKPKKDRYAGIVRFEQRNKTAPDHY